VRKNARLESIRPAGAGAGGPSYDGTGAGDQTCSNGAKHKAHHVAVGGNAAPHDVQLRTR